jgi:hypothetical protein
MPVFGGENGVSGYPGTIIRLTIVHHRETIKMADLICTLVNGKIY